MRIWHYFNQKGTPEYLAKHYWWAYIWQVGVWFFDHQPIISAILFGYYQSLLDTTLKVIGEQNNNRFLQIACVYGKLTPSIANLTGQGELHVIDVADIQLQSTRNKLKTNNNNRTNHLVKMNAENLAYAENSFDTVLIFFLLHEMPHDARLRTLSEVMRVLSPNGRMIVVEYGELTRTHFLHRFFITRYILAGLEPFLPVFWQENLVDTIEDCAAKVGKKLCDCTQINKFNKFYRVVELQFSAINCD